MSTSIFSSWKVRVIFARLLIAFICLSIALFKNGYEKGRHLRKAYDRAAGLESPTPGK